MQDTVPLNLISYETMWLVARKLRPGITPDEFEAMWVDCQRLKAEREARRAFN